MMAFYLKTTAIKMSQEVTWISTNSTRDVISKKLEELQIFALYPLSLTDEKSVLDFYLDVCAKKQFYTNLHVFLVIENTIIGFMIFS
jgi:hypothetical protein